MLVFNLQHQNVETGMYTYMARGNDHAYIYITQFDEEAKKLKVCAYVFRNLSAVKVVEEVFCGDMAIVAAEKFLNGINNVAGELLLIMSKNSSS